jgi:hypothetical protein
MHITRAELTSILARIAYLEVCLTGSPRGPVGPPRPPRATPSDPAPARAIRVATLLAALRAWDPEEVARGSLRRLVARLREAGLVGDEHLMREAVRLRRAELGAPVGTGPGTEYLHLIACPSGPPYDPPHGYRPGDHCPDTCACLNGVERPAGG